jgi:hypothetical protein
MLALSSAADKIQQTTGFEHTHQACSALYELHYWQPEDDALRLKSLIRTGR